ncbi:hypothetical protein ACFLZ1_00120 [Patescibacteria group bacterium]
MNSVELIAVIGVFALASTLAYKSSFLRNKKIGYISLMQILLLVLIPGVMFVFIFSFLLDILKRPLNQDVFLNDKIITISLLLSLLYVYGGMAIHFISKTLSSYFTKGQKKSLVYKINKHFHHSFSHNLAYAGAIFSSLNLVLLETNHIPPTDKNHPFLYILSGLLLGFSLIGSLIFYEKSRWLELKYFFFVFWFSFILFLIYFRNNLLSIQNYPLASSFMVASLVVAGLNIFLSLRRIKHGLKF